MKIGKLLLLFLALFFIGQVHAGAWDELKPYDVTDACQRRISFESSGQ
jgi:hypothetical protein